MKKILILLFAIGIISFIQIAGAISTENEYGSVKALYNGQEATVKGVKLIISVFHPVGQRPLVGKLSLMAHGKMGMLQLTFLSNLVK